MSLWQRLRAWRRAGGSSPPELPTPPASNTVVLPVEPYVFECKECGKVFEARRRRPPCPECESDNVALMSE